MTKSWHFDSYFYCTVKRGSEEAAFTMKQWSKWVDFKLQHTLWRTPSAWNSLKNQLVLFHSSAMQSSPKEPAFCPDRTGQSGPVLFLPTGTGSPRPQAKVFLPVNPLTGNVCNWTFSTWTMQCYGLSQVKSLGANFQGIWSNKYAAKCMLSLSLVLTKLKSHYT